MQPPEQPAELRTAAGGFARFAKRLNTDSTSGVFMWVSIVLVFILIGALIAFACKSSPKAVSEIVPPVAQYPF
jgi:hypothetical protein